MKTLVKGEQIKAYFPGESMWVEIIEVINSTQVIAKLLNCPVATQVKKADEQGVEVPEHIRYAAENIKHDVKEWGELVELELKKLHDDVPPTWEFLKKYQVN